jgi:uncharacterized protein
VTEDEFVAAVLSNPFNAAILERLPSLDLSDAWLVSGALFQSVWNARTNRAPAYGIRDYDVFYFDPDTSWNAEDESIKHAATVFADAGAQIELRNQARVHLWFADKFGAPYPPLTRATDGIDRFLMHNAQVGIRPRERGFEIYAPHGLDDVAQMIVRPNRAENFQAERYLEKAERWKTLWPEITIIPA